jgi:molecular chaperone GrpE
MVNNKKSSEEEKNGKTAGNGHNEGLSDQMTDQQAENEEGKKTQDAKTGNAEAGEDQEADLQTKEHTLEALEERLKESENKYLRLAAEFDNYRKRTLREKAELTKFGVETIIGGLLPVVDDFDRAIESMNETSETDAIKKGVELIHVKFKEFLKQKGVKEIQAVGNEFDTDLHEAVTKIPVTSKKDKGKIVDVIEKGYLLHDKVIRYAKVVVGE